MRLPIQYALTYPDRVAGPGPAARLATLSALALRAARPRDVPGPATGLRGGPPRRHLRGGAERRQRGRRRPVPGRRARASSTSPRVCRAVLDHHDFDPDPTLDELLAARPLGAAGGSRWTNANTPDDPNATAVDAADRRAAPTPTTGQPDRAAELAAQRRGCADRRRRSSSPSASSAAAASDSTASTRSRSSSAWASSSSSTNWATSSPPSGATSTSRRSPSASARPCPAAVQVGRDDLQDRACIPLGGYVKMVGEGETPTRRPTRTRGRSRTSRSASGC